MPRFDKTGPEGKGPKTGRGLGNCTADTEKAAKIFNGGLGLGRGLRRKGFGRGRVNR